jgi:hypothetical protein
MPLPQKMWICIRNFCEKHQKQRRLHKMKYPCPRWIWKTGRFSTLEKWKQITKIIKMVQLSTNKIRLFTINSFFALKLSKKMWVKMHKKRLTIRLICGKLLKTYAWHNIYMSQKSVSNRWYVEQNRYKFIRIINAVCVKKSESMSVGKEMESSA